MTAILFIFTIIINIVGVAHETVNSVNQLVGLHMNGFLLFFIGWIIAMLIDSIGSNN